MTSNSFAGGEKETSSGALPAPLVSTVKWVGFPLSTPGQVGEKKIQSAMIKQEQRPKWL